METKTPITLVIADDHEFLRAGIRKILSEEPDMQVIGEAENGDQVKKLVASLRPQVLLLDLIMPDTSPAGLERWVRRNYPETITLVLTAHDRDAYLASMIEAGVAGYMTKNQGSEQLIAAIRRAVGGEILFDSAQVVRARNWHEQAGKKWETLTKREREVLQLLAEGLDNEAIAEKLMISPKTIEFHITNILKKLKVNSRHKAVAWFHDNISENLE
jgi:DNA-binding NarL/FixJ family response regulator